MIAQVYDVQNNPGGKSIRSETTYLPRRQDEYKRMVYTHGESVARDHQMDKISRNIGRLLVELLTYFEGINSFKHYFKSKKTIRREE